MTPTATDWKQALIDAYRVEAAEDAAELERNLRERREVADAAFLAALAALGIPAELEQIRDETPPDDARRGYEFQLAADIDGLVVYWQLSGHSRHITARRPCPDCGRSIASNPFHQPADVGHWLAGEAPAYHQCRPGWIEDEDGELRPPTPPAAEAPAPVPTAEERLLAALREMVREIVGADDY